MKILIAEDDVTSRLILENMLTKWGYDVVSATDGNDAWKKLHEEDAPKLVILDWMMPGIEGIEICRKIRETSKKEDQYTYITLLTAKESKENIVTGMDAGADDYITKPFDMHELRVRVRAGQRIVQLQSELLEAKKKLEIQSRTDPLTGVLNRRAILSQIESEISRAKRNNSCISISMLDLDHFKKINDTFGHLAGDAVLRESMNRVEETIRKYDTVGRFGGEEFIVVLPGAKHADAFVIAERIRLKINEKNADINGVSIPFTISQGLATSNGESTVDELIANADEALYRAKEKGRNRVEQASLQKE
ncbi:MAG: diguanylate cyclase [Deltaproteobacteria bacterium]|jgi:diguanylate cyclase (GGDEF)-like protein|nr:diguanylate cyclase [Deltaproteobacteria bacterium]